MLKRIFQHETQTSFKSLHDDPDSDDVALDIKSQAKVSRILRYSRDKPFKQALREKSRVLHTLSLSCLLANVSLYSFCSRNEEINKVVANLRCLKKLRCLNIDLRWLLALKKGHAQFVESLKHLKNLSVIHFYVGDEAAYLYHIPHLYKSLCKAPIVSKAEVRFSFTFYYGLAERSYSQLFRALSHFGCLTTVHLTLDSYNLTEFFGMIAPLQDYKSVSRIYITITRMPTLSDAPRLLEFFRETLKHVKSLKDSRVTFGGLSRLLFTDLQALVPELKKAVQLSTLK